MEGGGELKCKTYSAETMENAEIVTQVNLIPLYGLYICDRMRVEVEERLEMA